MKEIKEKRLYIKVGTYTDEETKETKNNIVLGYFILHSKKPYRATGCNFDMKKDFENAVEIDGSNLEYIKVNSTIYVNDTLINL